MVTAATIGGNLGRTYLPLYEFMAGDEERPNVRKRMFATMSTDPPVYRGPKQAAIHARAFPPRGHGDLDRAKTWNSSVSHQFERNFPKQLEDGAHKSPRAAAAWALAL